MQRRGSKGSVTSITSSSRGVGKKIPPTHMIIQRENDNKLFLLPVIHLVNSSTTGIKLNKTATFKNDLNSRKQERGQIIQLGTEEECMEQLHVFEIIAEIDEQHTNENENDELNDIEEEENHDVQEEKKKVVEKQTKLSFNGYKHMNNSLNRKVLNNSIKQSPNIVKQKEHMKSNYVEIDENVNESSSNEDDLMDITSNGRWHNNKSSNNLAHNSKTILTKQQTSANHMKNLNTQHHHESHVTTKSRIIIGSQSQNMKNNVEHGTTEAEYFSSEQQESSDSNSIICRYDSLSKKCNKLAIENAALQLQCDRLTKENEVLKKTTMPIPDAAGRLWFINMGKFFSTKAPDTDILKYAKALKITDPRDLIACIEDTTSNTARQVIRYLYSPEKRLLMSGTDIPETQRLAIREFAESQKGLISNRQFNEAVNGVFRSEKSEFKRKNLLLESAGCYGSNKQLTESIDKGHKTLKQTTNKTKHSQSYNTIIDKENNDDEEEHQNNE